MTLKKIPPQKFNHQPDECSDVMMYTLELSRPCTCKDERGKNDLWPSAYGLYLYNYICTLVEIFFLLFRMYSTWSGCFLHLLRDIHLCILYHPSQWSLTSLESHPDHPHPFSAKSGLGSPTANRGLNTFK